MVFGTATGATLSQVAEGREADVAHAVSVARRAFDAGVWRNIDPIDRSRILWKAAALLHARVRTIAEHESQQTGRAVRVIYAQLRHGVGFLTHFIPIASCLLVCI